MARPKVTVAKRSFRLSVQLTAAELSEIKAAAQAADVATSHFARQTLLRTVRAVRVQALRDMEGRREEAEVTQRP